MMKFFDVKILKFSILIEFISLSIELHCPNDLFDMIHNFKKSFRLIEQFLNLELCLELFDRSTIQIINKQNFH